MERAYILTSAKNLPRVENHTSSRIFLPNYSTECDTVQFRMAMLGKPHDQANFNPR